MNIMLIPSILSWEKEWESRRPTYELQNAVVRIAKPAPALV
jgi:hypothetical protein